jgi:hypothetical protein
MGKRHPRSAGSTPHNPSTVGEPSMYAFRAILIRTFRAIFGGHGWLPWTPLSGQIVERSAVLSRRREIGSSSSRPGAPRSLARVREGTKSPKTLHGGEPVP